MSNRSVPGAGPPVDQEGDDEQPRSQGAQPQQDRHRVDRMRGSSGSDAATHDVPTVDPREHVIEEGSQIDRMVSEVTLLNLH